VTVERAERSTKRESKHYADSIVVDTLGAIEGRTTVCPAAIVAL
jgi:hypothetical protein